MPNAWIRNECEAIVTDYFDMLAKEIRGEAFVKSKHRRRLRDKLNDRSNGSVEFKHQNISAILVRTGQCYILGYKPAWNYQLLLEEVVLSQLEQRDEEISILEDMLLKEPTEILQIKEWSSLFVEPPVKMVELQVQESWLRKPRLTNYSEREARNRKLGANGEEFVMRLERERLLRIGRKDLAKEIEWTSKEKGDGTGYDIRSFRGNTDEELFIEVKTTNSGKFQPFLISTNEVEFSNEFANKYSLYRLFSFSRSPHVFELKGAVGQHVNLAPKLFSANF
jgi:hypothetical protein